MALCELGAGVGIVSLVAARLGAREVTATDAVSDALDLCERSAALNGVSHAFRTACLRWQCGPDGGEGPGALPGGRVELVVATDVLYLSSNGPKLAATAERCVAREGGALLFLDSVCTPNLHEGFRCCLEQRGWTVECAWVNFRGGTAADAEATRDGRGSGGGGGGGGGGSGSGTTSPHATEEPVSAILVLVQQMMGDRNFEVAVVWAVRKPERASPRVQALRERLRELVEQSAKEPSLLSMCEQVSRLLPAAVAIKTPGTPRRGN